MLPGVVVVFGPRLSDGQRIAIHPCVVRRAVGRGRVDTKLVRTGRIPRAEIEVDRVINVRLFHRPQDQREHRVMPLSSRNPGLRPSHT